MFWTSTSHGYHDHHFQGNFEIKRNSASILHDGGLPWKSFTYELCKLSCKSYCSPPQQKLGMILLFSYLFGIKWEACWNNSFWLLDKIKYNAIYCKVKTVQGKLPLSVSSSKATQLQLAGSSLPFLTDKLRYKTIRNTLNTSTVVATGMLCTYRCEESSSVWIQVRGKAIPVDNHSLS